jgi:formate--tetrahydrofolate ligase
VHLKCRSAGLRPVLAVLVVTLSSLRRHGGVAEQLLERADVEAVRRGLPQLRVQVENLHKLGLPVIVARNAFPGDEQAEVAALQAECDALAVQFADCDAYARGPDGALALAEQVRAAADASRAEPRYLYDLAAPLRVKLERLATEIYRADGVDFDPAAEADLKSLEEHGFGTLPVCVAKTQHSLSDDERLVGVPRGHRLRIHELSVSAGAGFVVARAGAITRMPGMPREPGAHRIHLDAEGRIRGLF